MASGLSREALFAVAHAASVIAIESALGAGVTRASAAYPFLTRDSLDWLRVGASAQIIKMAGLVRVTTSDGKVVENAWGALEANQYERLSESRACERLMSEEFFMLLSQDEKGAVLNFTTVDNVVQHVMFNLIRKASNPPSTHCLFGLQQFQNTPLLARDKEGKFHVLALMFRGAFTTGPVADATTFNFMSVFGDLEFDAGSETAADFVRRIVSRFQRAFEVFFGEAQEGLTWAEAFRPFLARFYEDETFKWTDENRLLDEFVGALSQWFLLLRSDVPLLGVKTAWGRGAARSILRDILAACVVDPESTLRYDRVHAMGRGLPQLKRSRRGSSGGHPAGQGLSLGSPDSLTPSKADVTPPPRMVGVVEPAKSPMLCLTYMLEVLKLPAVDRWHCKPTLTSPCEWKHCAVSELVTYREDLKQRIRRFHPDQGKEEAIAALDSL
jgi:hypothetical protein